MAETDDVSLEGAVAYSYAGDGSRVEVPAASLVPTDDDSDDDEAFPPAPGFHADGSRQWRFTERADPRQWSNLAWIDANIDHVKQLGWIEDNPAGNPWTVEDATAAYLAWEERATAPYRYVDDGLEGVDIGIPSGVAGAQSPATAPPQKQPAPADDAQPSAAAAATDPAQPDAPPAPPAAPPAAPPPPPSWGRPADPVEGGTQFSDVMAELRQSVPENEGLWTATKAAEVYGDTDFLDETGVTAARQRAFDASGARSREEAAAGGAVSADAVLDDLQAQTDALALQAQVDLTRNRYQQSTDFSPEVTPDAVRANLDGEMAAVRQQIADDPASMGVGVTYDQQRARADATEYMARTGTQVDVNQPLSADQLATLEALRGQDRAASEAAGAAWDASPEGQQARADADRRAAQFMGEAERVAASQARVDEIMQTPVDER